MSSAEYSELQHAEKEVARLVEEIRFAVDIANVVPSAREALPGLRRKLSEAIKARDALKSEDA